MSDKRNPSTRNKASDRPHRDLTQRDRQTAKAPRREKAELREELEQATRQFLQRGGRVKEVPSGASAWEPGTRPPPSSPLFTEPKHDRTPLNDVVATIEARREAMKQRGKRARKVARRRARRRTLYDDFGEPIRRIWVEE